MTCLDFKVKVRSLGPVRNLLCWPPCGADWFRESLWAKNKSKPRSIPMAEGFASH